MLKLDCGVEHEDANLNVDSHLTQFPNSAIRITPKTTQRLLTNSLNLTYYANSDADMNKNG